jgi:Ribosomal silencing factor during starvation
LKSPRFCAIFHKALGGRPGLRRIDTLIQAIVAEAASWPLHPVPGSDGPEADTLVRTVLNCLDDSKAEDIITIDLHGKTILADVMIIATGRSNIHVGAIAFKAERHKPPRVAETVFSLARVGTCRDFRDVPLKICFC